MKKNLEFRRQFILGKATISQLNDWKYLEIGVYHLYAHPDLEVSQARSAKKTAVLIGSMFDAAAPEKENADIIEDVLLNTNNPEECFLWISRYAGCYALLCKDGENTFILHDARGLREIYYSTKENDIVCGSQPNLIAKFANPKLGPSSDLDLLDFYENHLWDSRWVGDETYFEGIKHLQPNHYLDIERREAHRYWPIKPISRLELDEAVGLSCIFLRGVMNAVVRRHSVLMAVTAGTDSRTLLAASRGSQDKIYYFVNNQGLGHSNPDISVPERCLRAWASISYPRCADTG